eukprot:1084484_1
MSSTPTQWSTVTRNNNKNNKNRNQNKNTITASTDQSKRNLFFQNRRSMENKIITEQLMPSVTNFNDFDTQQLLRIVDNKPTIEFRTISKTPNGNWSNTIEMNQKIAKHVPIWNNLSVFVHNVAKFNNYFTRVQLRWVPNKWDCLESGIRSFNEFVNAFKFFQNTVAIEMKINHQMRQDLGNRFEIIEIPRKYDFSSEGFKVIMSNAFINDKLNTTRDPKDDTAAIAVTKALKAKWPHQIVQVSRLGRMNRNKRIPTKLLVTTSNQIDKKWLMKQARRVCGLRVEWTSYDQNKPKAEAKTYTEQLQELANVKFQLSAPSQPQLNDEEIKAGFDEITMRLSMMNGDVTDRTWIQKQQKVTNGALELNVPTETQVESHLNIIERIRTNARRFKNKQQMEQMKPSLPSPPEQSMNTDDGNDEDHQMMPTNNTSDVTNIAVFIEQNPTQELSETEDNNEQRQGFSLTPVPSAQHQPRKRKALQLIPSGAEPQKSLALQPPTKRIKITQKSSKKTPPKWTNTANIEIQKLEDTRAELWKEFIQIAKQTFGDKCDVSNQETQNELCKKSAKCNQIRSDSIACANEITRWQQKIQNNDPNMESNTNINSSN